MPSTSDKQRRFMAAAAHNPRFAKKAGIKQSVAKEFNRADQGALRKARGGGVSRMLGRIPGGTPKSTSSQPVPSGGALTRVMGRIPMRGRSRPVRDPSQELLRSSDQTISDTGDGLRRTIGRIRSRGVTASRGGKIEKYAEGGKVGSAMSALRLLAKKYRDALDMGDKDQAKRIARQMEVMKSGSSKKISEESSSEKGQSDKLATFSKGGKVREPIHRLKKRLQRVWAKIEEDDSDDAKPQPRLESLAARLAKQIEDSGVDPYDFLKK